MQLSIDYEKIRFWWWKFRFVVVKWSAFCQIRINEQFKMAQTRALNSSERALAATLGVRRDWSTQKTRVLVNAR